MAEPKKLKVSVKKPLFKFVFLNLLFLLFIFNRAFIGQSLLAPLDIASTLFSKYQFVDPGAGRIPQNHYIIDGITYDLPLQYTLYRSFHDGEIPWWDPYGCAGRPFLADTHLNGLDPFRLLFYSLFPFEPAFNLTLICHCFFCGLGMFLLLTYFEYEFSISCWLALTYQFAGCFALHFCHPWITASFLYYPFLWMTWLERLRTGKPIYLIFASVLVGLIFYAGNLQSHAYLIIFSFAFVFGNICLEKKKNNQLFFSLFASLFIGMVLAAPILFLNLENFFLSFRTGEGEFRHPFLASLFSFSALFPWMLGTFRTLDLGKLTNDSGLGFKLYFGSATIFLSFFTIIRFYLLRKVKKIPPFLKTSIFLFLFYFFALATPLFNTLYTRWAALPVLAGIILAAETLRDFSKAPVLHRKLTWSLCASTILLFFSLNLVCFFIYPHLKPKLAAYVEKKSTEGESKKLREFQIDNLPAELSVLNPETDFAFLSLLLLAAYFARPQLQKNRFFLSGFLFLNLLPVLLFFHRFIPNQDVELWNRLRAGGPEQQKIIAELNPTHERLLEMVPSSNEALFPGEMETIYQVHTVHGHTSLWLPSIGRRPTPLAVSIPPEHQADYIYESTRMGGSLLKPINTSSRFYWEKSQARAVTIKEETMNHLTLEIAPGNPGFLVRTDTYYPGWKAQIESEEKSVFFQEPFFSKIFIPSQGVEVKLNYEPRFLKLGILSSIIGVGALAMLGISGFAASRFFASLASLRCCHNFKKIEVSKS